MYPLQNIVLYEVDTRKLTSDQFLWSLLENNTDFFTISESGAKYIVENKLVNNITPNCIVCSGECKEIVDFIPRLFLIYEVKMVNIKRNDRLIMSLTKEMVKQQIITDTISEALIAIDGDMYPCISLECILASERDRTNLTKYIKTTFPRAIIDQSMKNSIIIKNILGTRRQE